MAHRRGNPNFGKPGSVNAALSESSFDKVVDLLKLSPEQYQNSPELREWVWRNKDEKYVPSELLKAYGFRVNVEG